MEKNIENITLIQNRRVCYVCGTSSNLHLHHIFYGTANRKKSDADKMTIFLCANHHNMSNVGIHFNKQLDLKVKQHAEKVWIDKYADKSLSREEQIEQFISRFGRNYLDE